MDRDIHRLTRRLELGRNERLRPRWQPAADIYRTREGWLVKLELAGIDPDAVAVLTHGPYLVVRGERRDGAVTECQACHSMEISYTRFERTFELPLSLEHARVASDYRQGMLLVFITPEEEQP